MTVPARDTKDTIISGVIPSLRFRLFTLWVTSLCAFFFGNTNLEKTNFQTYTFWNRCVIIKLAGVLFLLWFSLFVIFGWLGRTEVVRWLVCVTSASIRQHHFQRVLLLRIYETQQQLTGCPSCLSTTPPWYINCNTLTLLSMAEQKEHLQNEMLFLLYLRFLFFLRLRLIILLARAFCDSICSHM